MSAQMPVAFGSIIRLSKIRMELPKNAVTGALYQGGNIDALITGEWATFRQWVSAGRVVRKGEHGRKINAVKETEDAKGTVKAMVRRYTVFERLQTEPLTN